MGRFRTVVVVGLLAGGVGAGAGAAAAQAAEAQVDPDVQEVRDYRLSMDVVRKIANANKAAAAALAKDPGRQQLAKKKAELAALEEKEEPTEADQERMAALEDEIDRLEESDEAELNLLDAQTISEMARRIDAVPALSTAVRSADLTTREYATAQLALLQTGLAYGLMKLGHRKQPPEGISQHNLDFMRQHEAEIEALGAAWRSSAGER
jgi:hypothetical protein